MFAACRKHPGQRVDLCGDYREIACFGGGGQDFGGVSYGGYFPNSNTGMVAANGSTLCTAGVGLYISPDGGKTFAQYTAASGLGGELGNGFRIPCVAMDGTVIYCGNLNYIARLTPR